MKVSDVVRNITDNKELQTLRRGRERERKRERKREITSHMCSYNVFHLYKLIAHEHSPLLPPTHTHTLSTPLTLLTDIMLVVRVPVLSEQITEVQPSVSTEGRLRTMAFLRAMRRVPSRVFGEGGNDCMAVVTHSTTKTCKVPLFKEPIALVPSLGARLHVLRRPTLIGSLEIHCTML